MPVPRHLYQAFSSVQIEYHEVEAVLGKEMVLGEKVLGEEMVLEEEMVCVNDHNYLSESVKVSIRGMH